MSQKKDSIQWNISPSGFSVSQMYTHLSGTPQVGSWSNFLWSPALPPKVAAFTWLACLGAVPTKMFLEARGIRIPICESWCRFCDSNFEEMNHLLIFCFRSWRVWSLVTQWWGIDWCIPANIQQGIISWNHLCPTNKAWSTLFSLILWELWLARNELVFNNKLITAEEIFIKIQHSSFALEWALFKRNYSFSFGSWQFSPQLCRRVKRRRPLLF